MNHNWKNNFFKIWTGQGVSLLTSSILQFAIVWYLVDQTGSALILTASMLMGFLPRGILGPFIGVAIDRLSRKTIMIVSDLVIAFACLMLAVVGSFGEIPVWLIMVVLFIRSIGTGFHDPSLNAVTAQIVPADELTKYAGYSQGLNSVSNMLSPVLAGILYGFVSLNVIIFLDVIGALIAITVLMFCYIPKPKVENKARRVHVIEEAKEGFEVLKSKKGVMGLVLVGSLYTIALMPTSALFPLMSMSYFGGNSRNASAVEFVFSVGLLVGSVMISKFFKNKNKLKTIVFSYLLMSVSLIGSGILNPDQYIWFVGFSFLMGLSGPFYWGMYTPLLQQSFQEQHMGRVLSLSQSIQYLAGPIGLGFSGVYTEVAGVENWFLLAGIITLVAALICFSVPSIRNCDEERLVMDQR